MVETNQSDMEPAKALQDLSCSATSDHIHHTWAHTFYSRPEYYFQPTSLPEIREIIRSAHLHHRRIVLVGSGHSPSDLTCTSSWMINLDHFNRILSVDTQRRTMRFEAGIRLHDLNLEAKKHNLTIPNLGSIDAQSVAGAIATGTHGSTLRHGLVSDEVRALRIMLASGEVVQCSAEENLELFRAALVSLGALGVVVEIEMAMAEHCNIEWEQRIQPLSYVLEHWDTTLWTQTEFVRVWWLPHTRRAIVWKADKTDKPLRPARKSWYGGKLGYYTYYFLLLLSHKFPSLLPSIEWFVFGMQYGFSPGKSSANSAVQEQREGLLMDCLYSQFVNEWAIPLNKGPEAIRRLSGWLNGADQQTTGIPFDNKNLYVHAPIEVRVTNTSDISGSTLTSGDSNTNATSKEQPLSKSETNPRPRPFLDPTITTADNNTTSTPTLYLNATLYRPWGLSPPSHERYYAAFEFLMRQLDGRPHWAKNFTTVTAADIRHMYGGGGADFDPSGAASITNGNKGSTGSTNGENNNRLSRWLAVRQEVDPQGMFVGDWLRRFILGNEPSRGPENMRSGETRSVNVNADSDGKAGVGPDADADADMNSNAKTTDTVESDAPQSQMQNQSTTAIEHDRPSFGLPLEEVRVGCKPAPGGGLEWSGQQVGDGLS